MNIVQYSSNKTIYRYRTNEAIFPFIIVKGAEKHNFLIIWNLLPPHSFGSVGCSWLELFSALSLTISDQLSVQT